jgi:DNA-binding HxlR family transcriptional regulator
VILQEAQVIIKNSYYCALELAMDLIGGKWKLIILWHLRRGVRRHCELKAKLGNITQKILTLQLRELEEAGLVSRVTYPVVPPKVEYSLTKKGKEILPVVLSLYYWAFSYAEEHRIRVKPKTDLGIDEEVIRNFFRPYVEGTGSMYTSNSN